MDYEMFKFLVYKQQQDFNKLNGISYDYDAQNRTVPYSEPKVLRDIDNALTSRRLNGEDDIKVTSKQLSYIEHKEQCVARRKVLKAKIWTDRYEVAKLNYEADRSNQQLEQILRETESEYRHAVRDARKYEHKLEPKDQLTSAPNTGSWWPLIILISVFIGAPIMMSR